MERLKRRLDRVPGLLGQADRVVIAGLPDPDDVEGALRLEGLLALLAAHGLRAALAPPRAAAAGRTAGIWLGGQELSALACLPAQAPILLWPPPDAAAATLAAATELADRQRLIVPAGMDPPFPAPRIEPLPEPAHALWGLLDHHPRDAGGVLDLRSEGGLSWRELLPPGRIALALRAEALRRATGLAAPSHRARRRLLEGARRVLAAHAEVETDRVGASLLAALIGRPIRLHGAAAERYWRSWCPVSLASGWAA